MKNSKKKKLFKLNPKKKKKKNFLKKLTIYAFHIIDMRVFYYLKRHFCFIHSFPSIANQLQKQG